MVIPIYCAYTSEPKVNNWIVAYNRRTIFSAPVFCSCLCFYWVTFYNFKLNWIISKLITEQSTSIEKEKPKVVAAVLEYESTRLFTTSINILSPYLKVELVPKLLLYIWRRHYCFLLLHTKANSTCQQRENNSIHYMNFMFHLDDLSTWKSKGAKFLLFLC